MKKEDWPAIKSDYITKNFSYRRLAEKWGVSSRTISQRGAREGWRAAQKEYNSKVVSKTVQKVASETAKKNANRLLKLQKAADKMSEVIEKVFDDVDQFHRHVIQTRDGNNWDAEERVFSKIDTKGLRDIAGAMKDIVYVMRNVYDLPTMQEKSAMDMAAERLKLDKAKADAASDAQEVIVVEFAGSEEEKGWSE